MRASTLLSFCGIVGLVACGENLVGAPPPDGGVEDSGLDAGGPSYPEGPYGGAEGDILQDMVFAGYFSAAPEDGRVVEGGYQTDVSLSRIRALGTYRYLMLNVAALWCVACQQEAQVLPDEFRHWAPRGGYVMSVLIEDERFNPALQRHLDTWVSRYDMNYSMVHDPAASIASVFAPSALPLNAAIDLETMRILRIRQGDDPEFFEYFERTLDQGN